jgi:hypothetical protein
VTRKERLLAFAIGVYASALIAASVAFAHSWYDRDCCDLQDCEMIAGSPDSVKFATDPDGVSVWVLPNGEHIPVAEARQSLDREFHWCRYKGIDTVIQANGTKCLYVPGGGV